MLKKFKSRAKNWILDRNKKLTMCKKCYTFFYKNSWHFEKPSYVKVDREEEIPVRFKECPACLEQEDAFYERESQLSFTH